MQLRTRFAPSPTGLLHVGNAYSALLCRQWAQENGAELLLRIEDIDHTRCRPQFIESILEDLAWLGIEWPQPVRIQSRHLEDYRSAIHRLRELGVIYPCFCTRKSIRQEMERMALAPHAGDVAGLYPGICRDLSEGERAKRMEKYPFAWRLDIGKALAKVELPLIWREADGTAQAALIDHDEVIGRKDISFSYHLSVVVDDAIQGITDIIRGEDLKAATGIHRLLQRLLELPEPTYHHHRLLKTTSGERLAKRNSATTLASLRGMGIAPEQLRGFLLNQQQPVWPFAEQDNNNNREKIVRLLGNS
ncbi:glutamyl-Q tRNA(Asp) synthetase [Mariprofundus ferrinatatus]|uniref:Glutamyl-Q tRNA(Asp) synthetase n=1 Tax=Mariprofundus ferrinatatus TaxID=1921087 RepID=A0A2K8L1J9_9PROT|nr:tRNA glutamyl-Q(34) synthetase GluQRS [Mariprofundus ferrinatatus]ATX81200.1 glutamyl-Q tRNA(Asp) synthetase [Mariprofundus ferrinatatus]